MKKLLPVLILVLMVPSIGWSQMNVLQVNSVNGKVEIRPGASKTYEALTNTKRQVKVGDEIHTGPGASVVLTLPDDSYMEVGPNTHLVIKDFWSQGSVRTVVNQLLGSVRFYIQHIGGRPNPYQVQTPTALIAVRGTTFDVNVDASGYTEVSCTDGQVGVENLALNDDREVILNPGMHTGVSKGQNPLTPVSIDKELSPNRTLKVVKKGPKDDDKNVDPNKLFEQWVRDNDRSNRPADRSKSPTSGTDSNAGRAKPTMTFPE
jgi:hypothetical protein